MPTEPRRWRGAIVGVGGVAEQSHLPAFRDAAVAERLTISCAVDPAPAAAERAGGLPLVPGVDRLDTSRLDFLDVTTPTATHPLLARWALERGLHVLCEKPVATTRAEALALVSLAESRGRALVPCHQQRYNPVWRRVREWLSGGALGRWHLAEIAVYRTGADRGATGAGDAPWRTRVTDGGGVLADHGTHLLYTLLDLGGMPLRLQAWTARLAHRAYEVEDTAQVRLDFDEARAGTLFVTWAARRRETRVRIVGERGTITWVDGALTLERDGVEEAYDLARALDKAAYVSWFAELFATFADTLDEGAQGAAEYRAPGALARRAHADVVRVATVLEAAHASARTGATVDVPPAPSLDVPSLLSSLPPARVGVTVE